MAELVVVLTNCTPSEAPALGRQLVEEGYAACVNVIAGVKSIYVWQGRLCEDDESTLLIKTTAASQQALVDRLRELHSYTTPEVVVLDPSFVDRAYATWADEQVLPR